MQRPPPRSTLTYTLFPYTTPSRSILIDKLEWAAWHRDAYAVAIGQQPIRRQIGHARRCLGLPVHDKHAPAGGMRPLAIFTHHLRRESSPRLGEIAQGGLVHGGEPPLVEDRKSVV